MDARVATRSIRVPHRIFARRAIDPAPAPAQPLKTWMVQSLWLGLASGWLELGVILGHRALVGTVTKVSVRFNQYHAPLGLLAHLAMFAVGLGLAVMLSGRWTRGWWRDPLVTSLGWFLAIVSALLALEELHWLSSAILAAAISARVGPWWLRHRGRIMRRTLLPLGGASALLVGLGFASVDSSEERALALLPPARPDAPNVVLVVLDTVRADHLSLYGYHRPTTPHLDSLAGQAVCFNFARAAAPWTLPSHATMFTGRWPHELSVDYDKPLDEAYPTLAEYLGRHGYATGGFVGNTFYCNSWFGVARGFAHYEDIYENRTITAQETLRGAALTEELMPLAVQVGLWPTTGEHSPRKTAEQVNRDALAWLDRRGDRPFFLFLNYIDAHGPYTVPDDFPRKFSQLSQQEIIEANRRSNRKDASIDERHEAIATVGVDAYDDGIRYVDEQIDRLLAELERRGRRHNTWVIITADHGEHFGEHGRYKHGNSLYRQLVDVPLMIIPPGGGPAQRVTAPVSLRDLPATIADLVGLASASPFPGRTLRHHWDRSLAAPASIDPPLSELKLHADASGIGEISPPDRIRTTFVEQDRIFHRNPLGPDELYDVSDRMESDDLAPRPDASPILERYRALDEKFRATIGGTSPPRTPAVSSP